MKNNISLFTSDVLRFTSHVSRTISVVGARPNFIIKNFALLTSDLGLCFPMSYVFEFWFFGFPIS